ncbi:hypothetical protein CAPTEDRAFT_163579 [Capitella teleta]|uniref:C2H2-type domain-containing protein n=1 Tax=Capitella teleta TaxID=283909 RepID=R7U7W7_CAPTE|nr:hypothetical protein CAPTEDRAFT_163579 [Capitella teleta]|eukprot:ELU02251.1 hypothetical protein CAPTEDRAFT_163579 [Capitella teleta]
MFLEESLLSLKTHIGDSLENAHLIKIEEVDMEESITDEMEEAECEKALEEGEVMQAELQKAPDPVSQFKESKFIAHPPSRPKTRSKMKEETQGGLSASPTPEKRGRPKKQALNKTTDNVKPKVEHPEKVIFQCSHCARILSTKNALQVHELAHTGVKFPCVDCAKVFKTEAGLKNHRLHRHTEVEGLFKCSRCEFVSKTKEGFERHYEGRHGENRQRDFQCEICSKAFYSESILKQHLKCHNTEKKYECPHCDHVSHREDLIQFHVRNVHEEKDTFVCNLCGAKLRYRMTYEEHMHRHMGTPMKKCDVCFKAFYSSSALNTHKKSHQPGAHQCSECGKRFRIKGHLQRHLAIHTGARDFACLFCSYKCNVRSNLAKHVLNKHKVKLETKSKRIAPMREEEGEEVEEVEEVEEAVDVQEIQFILENQISTLDMHQIIENL